MEDLKQLYAKIMASDELKKQYLAAAQNGTVEEFAKSLGYDVTVEQIEEFLKTQIELPQGEIVDDELDSVAGGNCYYSGRPVVTPVHSCDYWVCGNCGNSTIKNVHGIISRMTGLYEKCSKCGDTAICMNCRHCHYESGLLKCYSPDRYKN